MASIRKLAEQKSIDKSNRFLSCTFIEKVKELWGCHQSIIKHKLSDYIIQSTKIGEENLKLAAGLKSHGFCLGLTICHAAMEQIGKLQWWEDALRKVAAWDGSKEQLQKEIQLVDSDKPVKLDSIINTVLNYVVYHHVLPASEGGIVISGLTQPSMLAPNTNFFEVQFKTPQGGWKTKKISSRSSAAGTFTKEQLTQLLEKEILTGKICILHSPTHAIRVSYNSQEKTWSLYNTSYSIDKMSESFKNLDDLVGEVKRIFHWKLTMAVDLITLGLDGVQDHKQEEVIKFNNHYNLMAGSNPISLLSNNGLAVMIKYQPKKLLHIIREVKAEKNDKRKTAIMLTISKALTTTRSKTGTNNLMYLLKMAPECFEELISLIDSEANKDNKDEAISCLINALSHKNINNLSGFDLLYERYKNLPHPLTRWIESYRSQLQNTMTLNF